VRVYADSAVEAADVYAYVGCFELEAVTLHLLPVVAPIFNPQPARLITGNFTI